VSIRVDSRVRKESSRYVACRDFLYNEELLMEIGETSSPLKGWVLIQSWLYTRGGAVKEAL
jgi:hypothetical protein